MPSTAACCGRETVLSDPGPRKAPGTARRLAFDVLHRVESEGAYASVLLDHHQSGLDDPREAALLRELVLGVLRKRAQLDHVLAGISSRPLDRIDEPVLMALRVGSYEILFLERIPDFASVDSSVELLKRGGYHAAAGFTNAVLRRVAREGRRLLPPDPAAGDVEALALAHSHPGWWVARVVERLGWDEAERLLRANNRPAATALRAADSADAPRLARDLEDEGVVTEAGELAPGSLLVRSGAAARTRAFREGRFWIQDQASQLVPLLFGARLGTAARIADVCAAPGGKTLALAAEAPAARVVACDLHPGRLRQMGANLQRSGAGRVARVAADMGQDPPPLRSVFDLVLVDAPCTGTGTLRRRPEIRWRLGPDDPARLAEEQLRILTAASRLLDPGGALVYAVCSLEPEEGPGVVGRFLERHPDFRVVDPRPDLPTVAALIRDPGYLVTSPAAGELDGFFAALLSRGRGT
jgi:16S rRNA (cytosine967-C5)-methyltransferase